MNRAWESPFRYIVITALLILFVWLLWYIRDIFRPLISAALIAYLLSPGVGFLVKRFHMRRKTAANIVYVAALAGMIVFSVTIVPLMISEFRSVLDDVNVAFTDLESLAAKPLQFGSLQLDLSLLVPALRTAFQQGGAYVPQPADALRFLQITSRGFLWTLVILVTTYYLLAEWDRLRDWLIRIAPHHERGDLDELYQRIRSVWLSYLGGQIKLMVILAVLYSGVWLVIGLPGALPLGFLAGLLNILPEVGPAAVAILATLVAYLEGSTLFVHISPIWFAVLTLGIYLLLNTFKTVYLQPRILGRSVFLHEAIVFIAIVTAIVLQGVLGVLIVVPLLASAIVVGKYVRRRLLGLQPFDDSDEEAASYSAPQPAPVLKTKSAPKQNPARKKKSK